MNDPTLVYSCNGAPRDLLKADGFAATFLSHARSLRLPQGTRTHCHRFNSRSAVGPGSLPAMRLPLEPLNLNDPTLMYSCKGVPSELPKPRGLPETSSRHAGSTRLSQFRECRPGSPPAMRVLLEPLNLNDPILMYSCNGVPSELLKPRGLPETSSRHAGSPRLSQFRECRPGNLPAMRVPLDLRNSGNAVPGVPLQGEFLSTLST
ncbi:hypothetical protein Y032_0236g3215 [Ancylostoma ceylanicum]|uniref:Uncharacterized protein n=1 Tax=Ancylostoma ceylanicum TaxID=53326 RepID=A0A016SFH5_9BILA|nr:hypothetical protein Y032_0236g3215 [Ancylostoma ceylanicum]